MNKYHGDQTLFSPGKKTLKKGKCTIICIFTPRYHTDKQTNKQTNKQTKYFNYIQAPGLHIIQYYNIYKTVINYNDDNNIKYKNYLHRGPSTPQGRMPHNENLDQSQNHF